MMLINSVIVNSQATALLKLYIHRVLMHSEQNCLALNTRALHTCYPYQYY